jgi:tetratricopeptide (TPR) repeat protein
VTLPDPEPAAPAESPRARWIAAISIVALVALVVVAYAPSLSGQWLDYDDGWLIRDNRILGDASPAALLTVFTDVSRATRHVLGAEYLPVRDLSVWLELRTFGASPWPMRAVSLAIYAAACALLLVWARRTPGVPVLAVWLFALHPVHVESAAWLAGRKDVLALFFTAAALCAWSSERAGLRRLLAPLLVALACFSKAMSVIVPCLFLAHDLLARRRSDRGALALAGAVAVFAAVVHAQVGATVSMYATLPGGSRLSAIATMAPVFWRYVALSVGVVQPSLAHAVPPRTPADPLAILALVGLVALVAGATWAWRRGERRPAFALLWFCAALLPVSQVLAPLQNRMADRYLFVAVLGPCVIVAALVEGLALRAHRVLAPVLRVALVVACLAVTVPYAALFADPVACFADLTVRAPWSSLGPYQAAMALESRGRLDVAEGGFREALRREGGGTVGGRRAANNLALLLARTGRRDEAIAILRRARRESPPDAKVLHNLASLLDDAGAREEARALFEELLRRFPDYENGRAGFQRRFGVGPVRRVGDGIPQPP